MRKEESLNISIHALREEGDDTTVDLSGYVEKISIHALREEGDKAPCSVSQAGYYFYPRPPRGGRHLAVEILGELKKFLSTPSARRATLEIEQKTKGKEISIHALREEGDDIIDNYIDDREKFLSTPSARRATPPQAVQREGRDISIHALREEGDPLVKAYQNREKEFLSTPSARRATRDRVDRVKIDDFYPRPPRGGRQQKQRQNLYFQTNYTTFCTNLEEP